MEIIHFVIDQISFRFVSFHSLNILGVAYTTIPAFFDEATSGHCYFDARKSMAQSLKHRNGKKMP